MSDEPRAGDDAERDRPHGSADAGQNLVEKIKGRAKEAVGAISGRDDITDEGRAQQDKAQANEVAAEKEAEARRARAEASADEGRQQGHQPD